MANEKSPVNKSENKSSRKKTVVYIALGSTGIAIIFFIFGLIFENIFISHQNKSVTELREGSLNQNKYNYKYINPLLACETASPKSVEEFGTLKDKIDRLINQKIVSGEVINMSVHFDMRDGRWLGINTDELYYPASLLKVPLMIATLKIAEAQPELLLKKNLYTGTTDLTKEQNFKPQEMLQPGHYYTTEDLLKRMIIYSDNNAVPLLLNNINSSTLAAVYSDLGIPMDNSSIRISVKEYANFFRILYNATYLTRNSSEKALSWLTQASFPDGIVGTIPNNISIAQKFGERNVLNTNGGIGLKELHDCGIIYYPKHPYLLCIMTRGNNFSKLANAIQDISRIVYTSVENEFTKN